MLELLMERKVSVLTGALILATMVSGFLTLAGYVSSLAARVKRLEARDRRDPGPMWVIETRTEVRDADSGAGV
jgi:hypothetical protein